MIPIVEEDDMPAPLTPSWRLHRRPSPRPDGQQRWDRAYLFLLQCTQIPRAPQPQPRSRPLPGQEKQRRRRRTAMTVALYVRVSTPHQAHTQTIEQQLERLHARAEECAREQPRLEECVVFRDDGYSGPT